MGHSNIALNCGGLGLTEVDYNFYIGTIIVLMQLSFGYTTTAYLQIKNKWITDLE